MHIRRPSVGVRLPLAADTMPPEGLLAICQAAAELGYESVWLADHVVIPAESSSLHPHTADGKAPFSAEAPWIDPLIALGWLAARLPASIRLGTCVLILTLRNPVLLAKQLSSLSWLTRQGLLLGVGSGWLREEYDAVGAIFEGRATAARASIRTIRELLQNGGGKFPVRGGDDALTTQTFTMLPRAANPVEFLWGGVSPLALRLVATTCDGWIPAKQSLESLSELLDGLRIACDAAGRDFDDLHLVAKPGPGPDPQVGAIDAKSLAEYGRLGFRDVLVELPYDSNTPAECIDIVERVAARCEL